MRLTIIIILFIGFLLTTGFCHAQVLGSAEIIQDPRIGALITLHKDVNAYILSNPDNYQIEGYRVQIFFDSGNNSSTKAKNVKEKFTLKYEKIPVYISWKAPNFRVRVGDFRTRIQAYGFLHRIIRYYPNAWVIKDEIKFPILN